MTHAAVEDCIASMNVQFNIIPPKAPHFGGLQEAAEKQANFLLLRVVGKVMLTTLAAARIRRKRQKQQGSPSVGRCFTLSNRRSSGPGRRIISSVCMTRRSGVYINPTSKSVDWSSYTRTTCSSRMAHRQSRQRNRRQRRKSQGGGNKNEGRSVKRPITNAMLQTD